MKIKKLLAIICVAALLVTIFAGCSGKPNVPDDSVPSTEQTQPPTKPTDPSTDSTDPSAAPSDPTDPSTDPTDPSSDPTEPVKPEGVIEDFESGLPAGADFYAPNTFPRIEEQENGNHVLAGQYSVDGTAWHGVKDANYRLGQSVNRLQITVAQTASSPVTLKTGNFWFDTDAGSLYPTDVKVDGNVYTLTFAQSFTVIKTFAIEIQKEMLIVHLDDLKIAAKTSGGENQVDPPVDPVDPPVDPVKPAKPEGVIEDFESGLPTGADFYAPNTVPRIEEQENGNHVLAGQYSVDGTAWHGVKGANYRLGQSVNRLQITVAQTASSPVTLKTGNFWFDTDAGSLYPVELKVEGNVYTLTFAQSFTVIKTFAIEIQKEMIIVHVDDLKIAAKSSGEEKPVDPPVDPVDPPVDPVDPPVDPVDPPVDPIEPVKPEGVIEDFENGLPAGADFYAPNTTPKIQELEDGNHVLAGQYSVEGLTAWHGISNANYDLGKSVNQIQLTFIQNVENPVALTTSAFWFDTDAGSLYPTEVKADGNVYTLTFAKSFTVIKTFAIEINSDMGVVYVDDLKVYEDLFPVTDPILESGKVNEEYTVPLPTVPANAENVTYTVSYRVKGETQWQTLEPTDGYYAFTPTTAGTYEIFYQIEGTVSGELQTYTKTLEFEVAEEEKPVKTEGVIEDFENGLPAGADFYAANTVPEILELEDGNHVLAGQYSADGTARHGISNANYDLGKSVNQIQLTFIQNVESPVTLTTGAFWFDTDAGSLYPAELQVEGNIYTLTFAQSFTIIKTFAIEISSSMGVVYVDDLKVYENLFPVTDPILESGKVNEEYTVPLPTVPVNAENVTYTISYRVKGDIPWQTLEPTDGRYAFTPTTAGTYEIFYQIEGTVSGKLQTYAKTLEFEVAEAEQPAEPEGVIEDFENGLPAGADFYAQNTTPQILELEDGNHVLAGQYSAGGTAWHGISNANYDLGKSVNQIQLTFIQNVESPETLTTGAFWFDTDAGSLYPAELQVEGNLYTLTFAQSFTIIKTFAIEISSSMGVVYVDDLKIYQASSAEEKDPYLIDDFADGDLSNVQSSSATNYEIVERDGEKWLSAYSTAGDWIYLNDLSYNCGSAMTAIDVVVSCEATVAKDWVYIYTDAGEFYASDVTKDGIIYRFTFATEFSTLNRFSMLVPAGTTLQIREIRAYIDSTTEEKNPYLIKDFADGDITHAVLATGTLSIQEIDGENWLSASCGAADWLYLKNLNYTNGSTICAIQIELMSGAALTANSIYLYTDAGAFYASSLTNEGNLYTFTFDVAFTTLNEISMLVNENTTLQIKQILAVP